MQTSSGARDRLLDTASELFYSEGINATGINSIVARSGVSKPTLYAYFHSKDELIAAVLERAERDRASSLATWVNSYPGSPRDRLLAVFDWLAQRHSGGGWRGCAFVNAAAELVDPQHPAREIARRQKRWMGNFLADLARDAGIADADQVGADLMLLVDGANARMVVDGDLRAAMDARRLAALWLDARESRGL